MTKNIIYSKTVWFNFLLLVAPTVIDAVFQVGLIPPVIQAHVAAVGNIVLRVITKTKVVI